MVLLPAPADTQDVRHRPGGPQCPNHLPEGSSPPDEPPDADARPARPVQGTSAAGPHEAAAPPGAYPPTTPWTAARLPTAADSGSTTRIPGSGWTTARVPARTAARVPAGPATGVSTGTAARLPTGTTARVSAGPAAGLPAAATRVPGAAAGLSTGTAAGLPAGTTAGIPGRPVRFPPHRPATDRRPELPATPGLRPARSVRAAGCLPAGAVGAAKPTFDVSKVTIVGLGGARCAPADADRQLLQLLVGVVHRDRRAFRSASTAGHRGGGSRSCWRSPSA